MFHHGGVVKTGAADGASGPLAVRLLVQPDADVIVKIAIAQIENANLRSHLLSEPRGSMCRVSRT
jgi:hypothetical protein